MGFAINPSLNHLDIPQKYILEIHQSTADVVLPDARFRGHPCEAYICISRVEKEMKAYVALLNNALKSTLVYTSDFVATTPQEYPKVLADAEDFVKSMGFTMQKINLDFSPAMREVIIKGLRVMRPPALQKRMPVKTPKIDVPHDLVVSTGLNEAPPPEPGKEGDVAAMTELLSLKAELASARAALEKVTREKVTSEQQRASERGALKAACEQAMEAKRIAEERLAQAAQELKKREQAPPQQESGELPRLRQQLDKEAAASAAAEKAREQLQAVLQGEREKIARLEGEKSRFEQRLAGEAEKFSALQAETARMKQQLEQALATRSETAGKLAAMAALEQSVRDGQQREDELRRHATTLEEKLAKARRELDETEQQLQQAEDLRQRLASAENELVTARQDQAMHAAIQEQLEAADTEIRHMRYEQDRASELQVQLAAVEAELATARTQIERLESVASSGVAAVDTSTGEQLARLSDEKEAVETEYVRLATESREKEAELAENLSAAQAEIERLTSELEIQGQVAAMEQAALRAELRRMIVGGGAASYTPPAAPEPLPMVQPAASTPVAAPPPPQSAPASAPQIVELAPDIEEEEDDDPDAPIVGDSAILQEFSSDLGGFYGGGGASNTEFKIDPAFNMITYSDPADVVAAFYS
ncbi:MAG TPA: hypothetical protein VFF53_03930, partial [Geobacteraceae bacterium]|nr:hypothetical protein [Geobacteraceae bacterium]